MPLAMASVPVPVWVKFGWIWLVPVSPVFSSSPAFVTVAVGVQSSNGESF